MLDRFLEKTSPPFLSARIERERVFNCKNCGVSIDRDLNASLNLELMPEAIRFKPV
ncbi:MAG: zinc ribbon domain-containing protein [Limnoraphis robusta]|jgi:transposase|uniref:zinc ribbon domain-containing protein n=1 Tax=Limnoraphis robusta TaxID=1118279 RepID=UPI0009E4D2BC|nr:zinc ribbon domain-containing protein [Limnoraphis robusta]